MNKRKTESFYDQLERTLIMSFGQSCFVAIIHNLTTSLTVSKTNTFRTVPRLNVHYCCSFWKRTCDWKYQAQKDKEYIRIFLMICRIIYSHAPTLHFLKHSNHIGNISESSSELWITNFILNWHCFETTKNSSPRAEFELASSGF